MYLVDSLYNTRDSDFIDKIKEDLQIFVRDLVKTRILLLPRFGHRHRFLVHQIVQQIYSDTLFSFSLGNGDTRRLFICSKLLEIK
jgi:hypothetical protein